MWEKKIEKVSPHKIRELVLCTRNKINYEALIPKKKEKRKTERIERSLKVLKKKEKKQMILKDLLFRTLSLSFALQPSLACVWRWLMWRKSIIHSSASRLVA